MPVNALAFPAQVAPVDLFPPPPQGWAPWLGEQVRALPGEALGAVRAAPSAVGSALSELWRTPQALAGAAAHPLATAQALAGAAQRGYASYQSDLRTLRDPAATAADKFAAARRARGYVANALLNLPAGGAGAAGTFVNAERELGTAAEVAHGAALVRRARELQAAGATPEAIHAQTGILLDTPFGGATLREIRDDALRVRADAPHKRGEPGTMAQNFEHPELFRAVPRLAEAQFRSDLPVRTPSGYATGSVTLSTDPAVPHDVRVFMGQRPAAAMRDVVHEGGHVASHETGLPRGANEAQFPNLQLYPADEARLLRLAQQVHGADRPARSLAEQRRLAAEHADALRLVDRPPEQWEALAVKALNAGADPTPFARRAAWARTAPTARAMYNANPDEALQRLAAHRWEAGYAPYPLGEEYFREATGVPLNQLREHPTRAQLAGRPTGNALAAQVIKAPGGNWLKTARYSPESMLSSLKVGAKDDSVDAWIEGPLTKYVRNDLGTARDPVRALAERGVLHFEPPANVPGERAAAQARQQAAQHGAAPPVGSQLGSSDLARAWEDLADKAVRPTAVSHLRGEGLGALSAADKAQLKHLPDGALVNRLGSIAPLGFGHLIDELRNATRAGTDLPPQLRLDPAKLSRVTMPQAVQLVDKINKWRAASTAKADLALATNPATREVAAYDRIPGTQQPNAKGLRWVELREPKPAVGESLMERSTPNRGLLADALSYEGRAMGHCVGGYCLDVQAGKSRIFSLRDAQGRPHVTIETQFDAPVGKPFINQIKGRGNAKPAAEYLPFVQDFVRKQGPWSDVHDIENADMLRSGDLSLAERSNMRQAGIRLPAHLTRAELAALQRQATGEAP